MKVSETSEKDMNDLTRAIGNTDRPYDMKVVFYASNRDRPIIIFVRKSVGTALGFEPISQALKGVFSAQQMCECYSKYTGAISVNEYLQNAVDKAMMDLEAEAISMGYSYLNGLLSLCEQYFKPRQSSPFSSFIEGEVRQILLKNADDRLFALLLMEIIFRNLA